MQLQQVHLENPDSSNRDSPYYYRSRVLTIRTDKGRFTTPNRITSRSEYNAVGEVPLEITPPLELAIDFKTIDSLQMKDFLNTNEKVSELIRNTREFNQITERAIFRISAFQPAGTALEGLNSRNRRKFVEMQADMLQIRLGTQIVTYPSLKLPFSAYKKYIDRYYADDPYSTIFFVDMNSKPSYFKKIIDYLIEKGSRMIGLIYSDWETSPHQHHIIGSEYSTKENLAFITCQVDRKFINHNVSGLHPLQFLGMDLLAPKQAGHGGESKPDLNKIEFFMRDSLGFENVVRALELRGTTISEQLQFGYTDDIDRNRVRKMIDNYELATNSKNFNELRSLTKIHESISSNTEFQASKELITSSESTEYFKMKPRLQQLPPFLQRTLDE